MYIYTGECRNHTAVAGVFLYNNVPTMTTYPIALRAASRHTAGRTLGFEPFSLDEAPYIHSLLEECTVPTCDFTVGGIYLWLRYFSYRRAVVDGTLFIEGVSEEDPSQRAFSVPVGGTLTLAQSVDLLRGYCREENIPLRFSAVPECMVAPLQALGARTTATLPDWADYVYDASSLAALSGKKMAKKRNHVNAFMAANPGWELVEMTPDNTHAAIEFMRGLDLAADKGLMAETERLEVVGMLENYKSFPMMEGALLVTPGHGTVAFTIGETRGDTLFVHVEKMRHDINGSGEAINALFARAMTQRHGITYINREDDAGDPGLRRAKESYHPLRLLAKYEMELA